MVFPVSKTEDKTHLTLEQIVSILRRTCVRVGFLFSIDQDRPAYTYVMQAGARGGARGCLTSHTPSGHEGVCDQQFLIEAHHSKKTR